MKSCLGTAGLFLFLWVRPAAAQDTCFTQNVSFQTYISQKAWLSVVGTGNDLLSQCGRLLQTPEKVNVNYYVALASFKSHDYKSAIDHAQTCIDLDANTTRCWLVKGMTYQKLKNNEKARESFAKVIALTEDQHDDVSQALRDEAAQGMYATLPASNKQRNRLKKR